MDGKFELLDDVTERGAQCRRDEKPKTWFRSERFFRSDDKWYFHTREGIAVGPYRSRFEAEIDAGLLKAKLRESKPEEALAAIRAFIMESDNGSLDIVNDPAFTSYVTDEGYKALSG
ncbi:MAG: DUF6316 family protein [Pseudomonadales bacterium]